MAKATKRAPKTRLHLDLLEERTLMSSGPIRIENFESGLGAYKTELRYQTAYFTEDYSDFPGDHYLRLPDDYGWINRTDSQVMHQQGDVLDTWVWLGSTPSAGGVGRLYFGFGANAIDEPGRLNSGGTLSFVIAPNTNQLILQQNNSFSHPGVPGGAVTLASVTQSLQLDQWYYAVVWWYTDNVVAAALYQSDTTLVNYVVGVANLTVVPEGGSTTPVTEGGLAFRSFGFDKWIYDVHRYPGLAGSAGGASPAGLGAPALPAPREEILARSPMRNAAALKEQAEVVQALEQGGTRAEGGAAVAGAGEVYPWQYASTPGTGRNIQMDQFGSPAVVSSPGITTEVALVAGNRSFNRNTGTPVPGTKQVAWGPVVRGLFSTNLPNESPLIQFFAYRRNGGTGAPTRICESDTKNFFLATGVDGQHLRPGERDVYGSLSENDRQELYSPKELMDPVTGRLANKDFFGSRSADGVISRVPIPYPDLLTRLCRVSIADLDPALHPAGTTWYMAGITYVTGDMDINDNSAWFQIVPTVTGSSVTVGQTGGTFQNMRTLPGVIAGAGPASFEPPVLLHGPFAEGGNGDTVAASLALPADAAVEVPVVESAVADEGAAVAVEDLAYLVNGTGLIPAATPVQVIPPTAGDNVFSRNEDFFADPFVA
jgi:hypothetical protein